MSLDLTDAPAGGAADAAPLTAAATQDEVARRYAAVMAERDAATAVAHALADIPRVSPLRYATDDAPVPSKRPPARHRRRISLRDLPALADRCWRPPLALAVVLFVGCGPAHAFGYTDVVYFAVLIGLALSGCAVPLGLLALRHAPPMSPQVAHSSQPSERPRIGRSA
ncbi:hypothetical protein EV385_6344 [Krasilnikovia cinnamomea]|uniref:Uncharacterized protein n=1 Tax=Krasilnikovia cinnamomea TaxID=349313 RepID=A0A4Q7ZUS6_9ACTN|nr:hypothetical protein [Krasilnikovia cinnamomea]RZU54393.1 hypothetical protein EV385_6344 [Krasilnikovia cinnamomea]